MGRPRALCQECARAAARGHAAGISWGRMAEWFGVSVVTLMRSAKESDQKSVAQLLGWRRPRGADRAGMEA